MVQEFFSLLDLNETGYGNDCEGRAVFVRCCTACSTERWGYTFLPGGHVLFGESARSALVREVAEELGAPAIVRRFLGVVEHSWKSVEGTHHELNLVFQMRVEGLEAGCAPVSVEGHLEFLWQPLRELKAVNLQPCPLQELLRSWLETEGEMGWGSSLYPPGSGESGRR